MTGYDLSGFAPPQVTKAIEAMEETAAVLLTAPGAVWGEVCPGQALFLPAGALCIEVARADCFGIRKTLLPSTDKDVAAVRRVRSRLGVDSMPVDALLQLSAAVRAARETAAGGRID